MVERLPLDGVRVFDLTVWLVGPWASMQLGAMGADVIHIEPPDVAWETLGVRIPPNLRGMPHGFIAWNMNKRQLYLDLKSAEGREFARELARTSDVFISNMRYGVTERLGLGYDTLKELNPRLVYVSVTGWGEGGPRASEPANDVIMQYITGFGSQSGIPGEDGEVSRHYGYFDTATGDWAAQAAILGLLARKRTGLGQKIEVPMLHALTALQIPRLQEFLVSGEMPPPRGGAAMATAPDDVFLCKDDSYIGVSVTTEAEWRGLCEVIRQEELAEDQRFKTNRDRLDNRELLTTLLGEVFRAQPLRHWVYRLGIARVPFGYPMRYEQLQHHQQVADNGFLPELQSEIWGPHRVGGPPWRFWRTPVRMESSGVPGADTDEIISELVPTGVRR